MGNYIIIWSGLNIAMETKYIANISYCDCKYYITKIRAIYYHCTTRQIFIVTFPLTGHALAVSFTWEKVIPANPADPLPAPRMFHAVGYFGQIQVLVIFGGQAENETILGDTWGFDFSDNTWKEVYCYCLNILYQQQLCSGI